MERETQRPTDGRIRRDRGRQRDQVHRTLKLDDRIRLPALLELKPLLGFRPSFDKGGH